MTEEAIGVRLRCTLCDVYLSASNESRIASSRLKQAGCKIVQSNPQIAAEVAASFFKATSADDSAASKENQSDTDDA